ncbi:hypothetical protein SAMN05421823_102541 [Catalinimonas alkaloidigena]|uniref:Uncharacterized protein n=1 Tax=Catalinimonas alkaloidigena TaxID=1075417 RepID=A0A1G9B7U5_9BACT|nr:hypothetical protein [Catalinimonas alkaloidigena]SDK35601.1 hypothetical protein SAMN05421823_102541 [Catalinimonas alkaloidigena]
MQSLAQPIGENLGGLIFLQLYRCKEVVRIPMPFGQMISQEMILVTDAQSAQLYFTPETGGFQESQEEDAQQGTYYSQVLSVFVPQDNPDASAWLDEHQDGEFIAIYVNTNGLAKLVGSLDNPLRLKAKLDTQKKLRGLAGHELTLSRQAARKAPFYLATPYVPPLQGRRFTSRFNFRFA